MAAELDQSIFTYDNYRIVLRDYFEEQKISNKNFSFRFFALKAGFKSHSFCDKILRGERNITLESVQKISKAMKLSKQASEFFMELVRYNQAKTFDEKQEHFLKLDRIRRKLNFFPLQEKQYSYLSNWHSQVIREVVIYGRWNGNYKTLGSLLIPPISEKEAESTVKMLVDTGLLKKLAGGKFSQTNPVVTGEGCPPHIVSRIRTQFLMKAVEAGETMPKTMRHLSYATISMSEKHYQEVSEMLDEMRKKILSSAVEDDEVSKVYSLNIQLYPLANIFPTQTIERDDQQ